MNNMKTKDNGKSNGERNFLVIVVLILMLLFGYTGVREYVGNQGEKDALRDLEIEKMNEDEPNK